MENWRAMPRRTAQGDLLFCVLVNLLVYVPYQCGRFRVPIGKLMTDGIKAVIDRECSVDQAVQKNFECRIPS